MGRPWRGGEGVRALTAQAVRGEVMRGFLALRPCQTASDFGPESQLLANKLLSRARARCSLYLPKCFL